ncbi:MFS general substrate transporter [Neoconidiobolus thromboides FSU 785]|nr:MFS general substrate transporter [Neoconidiobolus thromboides FSU 785]
MKEIERLTRKKSLNPSLLDIELAEIPKLQYTKYHKFFYLILASSTAVLPPLSSTIYLPSLVEIQHELNTNETMMDLSIALFLVFLAVTPLIWGNLADYYGRKIVYVSSLIIFIIGNIGLLFSSNIYILLIMRVIQSIGSSSGNVCGIGTISDIYIEEERGFAMGIFFLGAMIGPILGPILGGILSKYFNYKSIFIFLIIYASIILMLIVFFLKETNVHAKLYKDNQKMKDSRKHTFKIFKFFQFMNFIIIVLIMLYNGINFATYMLLETSHPLIMTQKFDMNSFDIGLSLIPIGCGNIVGSMVVGKLSDKIKITNENNNTVKHENKFKIIIVTGVIIILNYLLYCLLFNGINSIYILLVFHFFIGFSSISIMIITSTYLINLFPSNSSLVSACANFFRYLLAAILASFSSTLLRLLNVQGLFLLFTILAVFGYLIGLFIFFFGMKIRYVKLFK